MINLIGRFILYFDKNVKQVILCQLKLWFHFYKIPNVNYLNSIFVKFYAPLTI